MEILLGHSPDPDDAFMFYGLARGLVDAGPYRFVHQMQDIETLNRRALGGELHVTAVSVHAWAHLADRYALFSCGASLGDGYGPMLVARPGLDLDAARRRVIAVPGTLTSAYLALRLAIGEFAHAVVPFDEIPARVAAGEYDSGLLIHEGQLTYAREGLALLLDLGVWWGEETGGLPLPLGANAGRRDLGPARLGELDRILRASIRYGLAHRAEAVAYALGFGRGLDAALADRFVGMYVNDLTLDFGERGREAVRLFLARGYEAGLLPAPVAPEFIE
ncbi:MAG: ABC transporter substrate-binding protein [Candidatus Krumholzibacteriota bacterium]|nr:ABC transporter substrate-binding protein [Candidatus Krumholzibacteriota bacterium]